MKPSIPTLKDTMTYIVLSIVITFVFCFIYLNTNQIASEGSTYSMYFSWEKKIPFIPSFILIYFSLNLLMTAPLFYLKGRDILFFGAEIIIGTFVAGLIFLMIPGELGFVRSVPDGVWKPLYEMLFAFDKPHNLAPSLHIYYSYITIFNLVKFSKSRAWHAWGGLMCFSVLFTHQHHLFDIFVGLLLAFGICSFKEHIQKRYS